MLDTREKKKRVWIARFKVLVFLSTKKVRYTTWTKTVDLFT